MPPPPDMWKTVGKLAIFGFRFDEDEDDDEDDEADYPP